MSKIINFFTKAFTFVTHDIWHLKIEDLSKRKAFWTRQLKVFLITLREFNNGRVNVQASSLSFYLILSIVPIAALIFAVSSGFGIQEGIKNWLLEVMPDQQEIVNRLLSIVESAIHHARGGWVAGIGIIILLWSSMNMFVRIEEALNAIWQAKRPRSWARRFADYMSIMLIAPILLILSNGLNAIFRSYLEEVPLIGNIYPFVYVLISLIITWFIFTLVYVVMPNVKVKVMPALTSAIIAGTVFYFVEQLYFYSQVSLSKYNAIYGSLAAIPLFLLCAKLGWQIVLLGAELSFAYQNIDSYEHEGMEKEKISHHNLTLLSLYILKNIALNFQEGGEPKPLSKLSEELGLSVRSLNVIMEALQKCGIVVEVRTEDYKDDAYVPATDVNRMTIATVLKKLEGLGDTVTIDKENIPPEMERISELMDKIYNHIAKEEGQIKIIDI